MSFYNEAYQRLFGDSGLDRSLYEIDGHAYNAAIDRDLIRLDSMLADFDRPAGLTFKEYVALPELEQIAPTRQSDPLGHASARLARRRCAGTRSMTERLLYGELADVVGQVAGETSVAVERRGLHLVAGDRVEPPVDLVELRSSNGFDVNARLRTFPPVRGLPFALLRIVAHFQEPRSGAKGN